MATAVMMPKQGQSVESCIITKWNKQIGDEVAVGDILFSYETDKASFEEESKVAGKMLAIFYPEGEDVECLLNVCAIGADGEDVSEFVPQSGEEETAEEVKEEAATTPATAPAAQAMADAPKDGMFISPRAKGLAQKQGIDYRYATSSGPNGRVIERDVRALMESGMATKAAMGEVFAGDKQFGATGIGGRVSVADLAAGQSAVAAPVFENEVTEVPLTNMRKVIAKAMHHSLSTMAQLTLNTSFDATEMMAYRSKIKANAEKMGLGNITLNDIVLFAVSRTLMAHPDLNAHFYDDKMVYYKNVNLGMAVDTPRGLLVPTVFSANNLSLNDISAKTKELAAAAQSGSISPDDITGGTFTVTNLGSLGIESFTPVINPPQTGILGVNNIETKVKNVGGEYKHYPAMGLSLTFDHRAIDGAPAAKFLKDLAANLENFSVLLSK